LLNKTVRIDLTSLTLCARAHYTPRLIDKARRLGTSGKHALLLRERGPHNTNKSREAQPRPKVAITSDGAGQPSGRLFHMRGSNNRGLGL
jgi:hypothetical protein